MKVLVTGNGTSGSWKIRGEQLGKAMSLNVAPKATSGKGHSLAILVKKVPSDLLFRLRHEKVKIIWDIVDAWPQPVGNTWNRAECLAWLTQQIRTIKPHAVVAATKAMAKDLEPFNIPVLFVPHHSNPALARNPVREQIKTVGYQGGERYLGKWRELLEKECKARGWRFVVNLAELADVDVVVAMRESSGYAARHWKSGVKLSNAQGTGTPFIGSPECGYLEQRVGNCERFAETEKDMQRAFDSLVPYAERYRASHWMYSVAPRLDEVAKKYREWLEKFQ